MTSRFRVLPYKQGSASAKALAQALGGKVLKLENSKFKPRDGDTIINWGNTTENYPFGPAGWINDPTDIRNASNKKLFFQMMIDQGLGEDIPKFWLTKEEIPDEAFPIVCRTVLAGHSGAGIVLANNRDGLVDCPLYVQYVKKEDEYRVHCAPENIIAVQRKARAKDHENPNWQIRNHANGFIYARAGVNPPVAVTEVALRAISASGLDFGAVDVIYNKKKGKAYVLEINTAPGLEGQTIEDYANFFRSGGNPVVADVYHGEETAG